MEMEEERLHSPNDPPTHPPTSGTGDTHRLSSDATSKRGPDAAAFGAVFPFCPPLETSGRGVGGGRGGGWGKEGQACAHCKSIVWGNDTLRLEATRGNACQQKFQTA